jgi:hypothetical protein
MPMDLLPNRQNFDLDKSRQKFHHSEKGINFPRVEQND